ncbi:MAG: DEAD/DEAH box helicase [Sedimentisphaerales bacterium]|nr:DEAD/DEAH box helicase [Sedimentisphaerales bacterium]
MPEKEGETRFHDLGLPEPIVHAIADLGFKYCTPIQAKTLAHAHAGQNIAGRAQTGTGKTAAFLIAIFSRFLENPLPPDRPNGAPRALVLAPTRELAVQIVKDAEDLGKYCSFNCLAVYGGLEVSKQKVRLEKRPVDIIVATPGRLLDFVRRKLIDLHNIEELVIDEADRMLDMGFIPDVRRIIRQTPPKGKRRTMLFSATLTDDVLRLAAQWMPDPVFCEVEPEQVAVETVDQIVYIVTSRDKFKLLYNIMEQRADARTLIFCNRRDSARSLASNLRRHGVTCELLSGAVPQKKRLKILDGFRSDTIKVVVATDVAGRGLHVKGIDLVVNYEFPYEPEDYVHRIGRTGRAGLAGTSISFACEDESFTIPAIEKYIGNELVCTMPDEELLKAAPPASHEAPESASAADAGDTKKSKSGRNRWRRRKPPFAP